MIIQMFDVWSWWKFETLSDTFYFVDDHLQDWIFLWWEWLQPRYQRFPTVWCKNCLQVKSCKCIRLRLNHTRSTLWIMVSSCTSRLNTTSMGMFTTTLSTFLSVRNNLSLWYVDASVWDSLRHLLLCGQLSHLVNQG